MEVKFKVGDKVRIIPCHSTKIIGYAGDEGVVTKLGGTVTPDRGAVVTNEKFPSGDESYGKHGIWFPDDWLELV